MNLSPAGAENLPLIIYLNHPGWWDPIICLILANRLFPNRYHFAPIDAAMLGKYRFFERLGFFGVEPGTARGAMAFLRAGRAICAQRNTGLWITAQGEFTDVRSRPVRLKPGLSHLLRHVPGAVVLPLAIEYVFWNEKLPEALVHFGEAIEWQTSNPSIEEVGLLLESRLAQTQDALADLSCRRNPADFNTLVSGTVGVGGVYDAWRRTKSWINGQKFEASHGPE